MQLAGRGITRSKGFIHIQQVFPIEHISFCQRQFLFLGEFRQLHPEIQLEITESAGGAALDMVEREEVDLAFVHDAEGRPNLSLRKLSTRPICLCVPREHPLTGQKSVTLAKAAGYPLVLLSRNFILTRQVLAEFAKPAGKWPYGHSHRGASAEGLYRHEKRAANLRR